MFKVNPLVSTHVLLQLKWLDYKLSPSCPTVMQTLRADQLPKLPGLPELPAEDHLLLPQLPAKHSHPCSDLPNRTLARVLGGQRHCDHHGGQRGKLLQHPEAQRVHGRRLPSPAGGRSKRFLHHGRDEAVEAGSVHHLPSPHLRLHHRRFLLKF